MCLHHVHQHRPMRKRDFKKLCWAGVGRALAAVAEHGQEWGSVGSVGSSGRHSFNTCGLWPLRDEDTS